jgi:Mrp family chromosome partitioning ATPase
MDKMLQKLRGSYDYIILDLPPVGEVSDALAVARITDGMLLVVRQNQCDRHSLGAAIRQFEFVGSRILGVVFNCVGQDGTRYGKYRYRYYRKYYRQPEKRV